MRFVELQRGGPWLPAAFLSLLVPATASATIASSYLRAEATALFQKLLSLLSKEDLAAKATAASLAPLTAVFLSALDSANDDARRAKQALTLGLAIVGFAEKLPASALKPKAVTALWGEDGTVRASLTAVAADYTEEKSVGSQCTRILTAIKQVRAGLTFAFQSMMTCDYFTVHLSPIYDGLDRSAEKIL